MTQRHYLLGTVVTQSPLLLSVQAETCMWDSTLTSQWMEEGSRLAGLLVRLLSLSLCLIHQAFSCWCWQIVSPGNSLALANRLWGLPISFAGGHLVVTVVFAHRLSVLHLLLIVACGGTYTDPTGVLVSPLWPDHYPNEKTCYYHISAPQNKVVKVTFSHFQIESDDIENGGDVPCVYDYLAVSCTSIHWLFSWC